jgi:hypothetical protein
MRYCGGIPLRLGWKIRKILRQWSRHLTMYFYFKTIALSFCSGRTAQAAERLGRWFRVRFSAEERNLSLLHGIVTGPGSHAASYTMGTGGCFSRNKAAGERSSPLSSSRVHLRISLPPPTHVFMVWYLLKPRDAFAFTSLLTWDCYNLLWRIWKSSFSWHFWKVVLHSWSQDRVWTSSWRSFCNLVLTWFSYSIRGHVRPENDVSWLLWPCDTWREQSQAFTNVFVTKCSMESRPWLSCSRFGSEYSWATHAEFGWRDWRRSQRTLSNRPVLRKHSKFVFE